MTDPQKWQVVICLAVALLLQQQQNTRTMSMTKPTCWIKHCALERYFIFGNYDEYIGIGPGAHSRLHEKDGIKAMMMIHKPASWLQSVMEKGHGIQNNHNLLKQEIIEEIFMMGTRLEVGISENKF